MLCWRSAVVLAAGLWGAQGVAAQPIPFVDRSAPGAPVVRGSETSAAPLKDASGRTHYIVDLHDAASSAVPADAAPPSDGFSSEHDVRVRHLIEEMRSDFAFVPTSMTSFVGRSFSAFLSAEEVERLRKDVRVKRLTEDRPIDISAVWSDTGSNGITPWGIHAVGGPRLSNQSRTVYLLDTGVAPHGDLNTVERLTAVPGQSPTGCYPHATHVAGIIGARSAAKVGSVVGVNAGAPIVSVAVGRGGSASKGCSSGSWPSDVAAGLDLLYSRILASGTVGIVNISLNDPTFRVNQTLGDKVRVLATPNPAAGYPGAFIAQSAGNNFRDACGFAYNAPQTSDGIMVVGAIDDNGQPVSSLNGAKMFRNQPLAGDEPGSNYGTCVEMWAPGNVVRSTWSGGGYTHLSGTSMSAPHVAGIAAHLAETLNLTTPAQIELAVRARRVTLSGSTAFIPNLNLQGPFAQPTVELAIGMVPLGHFNRYSNDLLDVRFDSLGAASCRLDAFRNGAFWYRRDNLSPKASLQLTTLPVGQYRWVVECTSANGARRTSTEATGTILRTVTRVAWLIKSTSTGNAWREFTGGTNVVNVNTFQWAPGTPVSQRYESVDADWCEVTTQGVSGFGNSQRELWASGAYPTSLDFGTSDLGDPRTQPPPLGPHDLIRWTVECRNVEGSTMTAIVHGTQSP